MTDSLVHIVNDTPLADSRLIAKGLGIDHHNFMQTIKKYQSTLERRYGQLLFKTEVEKNVKSPNPPKFALLTDGQAAFVVTLSKNYPNVVEFKADLVDAFIAAREKVHQLLQSSQPQIEAGTPVSKSTDSTIAFYVETTITELMEVETIKDLKSVSIKLSMGIDRHERVEREIKESERENERKKG